MDDIKMVRIANIIFLVGFTLCATVIVRSKQDCALPVRNIVWGLTTLALFTTVIFKRKCCDFSILKNQIFAVFLFYWIATVLSIYQASNIGEALYGSFRAFMMMTYLFLTVLLLKEQKYFSEVVISLTLGLCFFNLCVLFKYGYDSRFFKGLMATKNINSSVFFLLAILCLHYWKSWKIPATIAIILSAVMVFALGARSSWLAVIVAVMVFAFTYRKYAVYAILGLILVCGVTYGIKGNSIFNVESLKQRAEIWNASVSMVKDNPNGVGAENWKMNYLAYSGPITSALAYNNRTIFISPHNGYLKAFSESGYLGFVCYVILYILALYYSSGMIRIGIAGYMTIDCFSFPQQRPFTSILLMIFFAIAILQYHKPTNFKVNTKWFVPVCLILSLAVVDCTVRQLSYRKADAICYACDNGNWDVALSLTDKISWLSNTDITGTPLVHFRGVAYFRKGDIPNALKAFHEAESINKHLPYTLYNIAMCYGRTGQIASSIEYFRAVIRRYPDYPEAKKGLMMAIKKYGEKQYGYEIRNI